MSRESPEIFYGRSENIIQRTALCGICFKRFKMSQTSIAGFLSSHNSARVAQFPDRFCTEVHVVKREKEEKEREREREREREKETVAPYQLSRSEG